MLLTSYLTFQRGSSDKFYDLAAHRACDFVYVRYGRAGTDGNTYTKKFSSPRAAVAFYDQKLSEKRIKGYVDTRRPSAVPPYPEPLASLANANHDTPQDLTQAAQPPPVLGGERRPSDYTLTWATTKPITPALVETAFAVTSKFFKLVETYFPKTAISMADDGLGPYVRFMSAGKILAMFGYPPQGFLESLTLEERRRFQKGGVSSQANGWLTGKGMGSGIIFTHMKRPDMLVRLFLSVLQVKAGLQVACSLGLNTSAKGLFVSDEFKDFGWYPFWKEDLYPAARRVWLIHGESIFRPSEAQERKNQYGLPAKYAW